MPLASKDAKGGKMPTEKIDLKLAYRYSSNHRQLIETSRICGCFNCLAIFPADEIAVWVDEPQGGMTACCPRCDVDSVIGSASGFPITREFLDAMRMYWF
jgi:hypothetical protein